MPHNLYAVILAGGKSTRLGKDKVKLDLCGRPLLVRAVELLSPLVDEVVVSGRDTEPLGLSNDWFIDEITGAGPIGGVMTALRKLSAPCLCVSCDLPLMRRDILEQLLDARQNRPAETVMTTFHHGESGYIESMVAIYEPEALPLLESAVAENCYKLSAAMPKEKRLHVPFPEEEAMAFFNLNYPADLAMLRKLEPSLVDENLMEAPDNEDDDEEGDDEE